MIKIIKSLSLSLSHSHISVSTSPTHASAGLNVTNPSPKPLIHISDPYLCPILHLNAHLTPNHAMPIHISNPTPPPRPLLWFSADQTITLVFRWSDPSTSDPFLFQRSNPRRHYPLHRSPAQLCDWWLFILFGLNWEKRLETSVGGFFFFFFLLLWTSGGGGWCCGCFLDSGIYYFIMMFILFYCIES